MEAFQPSGRSAPRLITLDALTDEEYAEYLRYVSLLQGLGAGERDTIAMAWAKGFDVCSNDKEAADLFREHRPDSVCSRYICLMDYLRELDLIH